MIKGFEVFGFVENFKLMLEDKKPQSNSSFKFRFNKTNPNIRNRAIDICNEINCSHYSFDDFKYYVFYYHLYNDDNFWFKYNKKDIGGCKNKFFSKDSLKNDKSILLKLNKDIKFTIDDYLIIQENGECYLYTLLKGKHITPSLYLNLIKYIKETDNISKEQKKANRVARIIKEINYGKA